MTTALLLMTAILAVGAFYVLLPVILDTSQVVNAMKLGPAAAADRMNRKKVEGQSANPSRKANGRPRKTP